MKNETLGKENFNSLINKVYQQLSSINSIERQNERLALLRSLKIFEGSYVYNWQRFIFPIFSGMEQSPYKKYSGFRSAPWAEYDVLDPVHGGASGWTLTAEPWATEEGLPCLWDFTRGQPNSITGAIYCLSSRIDQIRNQEIDFEAYDDTEIQGLIHCNTMNIETLYKDVYACDLDTDCSGEAKLRYSFQRHLYEIFSQIINGGPDLSGDYTCEDDYPELFLNISTCDISWDPSCPLVELDGDSITGGAKIELVNNNSPYDHIDVIGTGGTTVTWDESLQRIEIQSNDADTIYDLSSKQNGSNVDIDLTDSGSNVDTVTLTAGTNVTLTDDGSNSITIDATDTTYTNTVSTSSTANSIDFKLVENNSSDSSVTNILGEGTVSITRVSDSQYKISGSESVIGLNDSESILGQGGLTPIPSEDYYREKEEDLECCYEFTESAAGTNYTKAYDEWAIGVPSGGTVSSGTTRLFQGAVSSEYSFNASDGMSLSFWVKKDIPDSVTGIGGRCVAVAFENVSGGSATPVFSVFFNNASEESSDPDTSTDYCLYLETSKGAFVRLANFSDSDGNGTSIANTWQHVAISWEDLDNRFLNFKFYRGGKEESHSVEVVGSGSGFDTYTDYSVYAYGNTPSRKFDGHMKKLAIFKEYLTANEVAGVTLEEDYNSSYTQTQWLTSNYINGKLGDWWDLGNLDQIVNNTDAPFSEGQSLSQNFQLNGRMDQQLVDGANPYSATSITGANYADFTYSAFNFTASLTLGGGASTGTASTASLVLTSLPDISSNAARLTLVKVNKTASGAIEEDVVFKTTTTSGEQGTTLSGGEIGVFLDTTGTIDDFGANLASAIDGTSDFNSTYDSATDTVSIETVAKGYLHNTSISYTANLSVAFSNPPSALSGGVPSGVACLDLSSKTSASTTINFVNLVPSNATIELISTKGTSLTYIAVDDSSASSTGTVDGSGNIIFKRGDSESSVGLQKAKALENLRDAINSLEGHNEGFDGKVFELLLSTKLLRIVQKVPGAAGNTTVTITGDSGNAISVANTNAFVGGTEGSTFSPANKEQFSQTALFNKWDCSTVDLDLTIGNRYDITLTGYNTFKLATVPWCVDLDTSNISNTLVSAAGAFLSITGGSIGQLTSENVIHLLSQLQASLDIAGVGLNIRNENACIDDPRNIFIATNYYDTSNQVKSMIDPGGTLGADAGNNVYSKSVHLGKYSFRSFFSKWKINLSLTVGPPSDGDSKKVNLYYKGEGVEIDLIKDAIAPFQSRTTEINDLGGASKYNASSETQNDIGGFVSLSTINSPNHSVPQTNSSFFNSSVLNRFEMDHYNPFRHTYFQQWNAGDIFALGVEDLSKRMEGNVIENIAKEQISTVAFQANTFYEITGTVNTTTSSIISSGDYGIFLPLTTTQIANSVEITFNEYAGYTFYLSNSFESLVPFANSTEASKLKKDLAERKIRVFKPPQSCIVEPYNRMEIVTWGFDSGIFSSLGGNSLYAEPDGDIWIKVHLEEFTIKKFTGTSLCSFEGLAPFSSVDFHWSGGPSDSNCGACTEWKIVQPFSFSFTLGGNAVTPVEDLYVYDTMVTDLFDKNGARSYVDGGCSTACDLVVDYTDADDNRAYYLPDYVADGTEEEL